MLGIKQQFSGTGFLAAVAALAIILSLVWSMPAAAQDSPGHFEAGGNFTALRFNSAARFGPGLEGDFNFGRHFALDGAFNWLPAGSGDHTIQGLFGGKVGTRTEHFGFFGKVRPGFISRANQLRVFNEVPPFFARFARLTERAIDFGGVLEYYPAKHWALRYDFGDLVVFEEGIRVIALPPLTSLSTDRTSNNFQFSTSLHYRF